MQAWLENTFPNIYQLGLWGESGWLTALSQTLYMTFGAAIFGGLIGLAFGIGLVVTDQNGLTPRPALFQFLDKTVSIARAIPFIIMVVAFAPVTQFVTGTTIGATAALVPLSLGVFPFFARQVQVSLLGVAPGKVEAARAYGATNGQIIRTVYLREGRAELIRTGTLTMISLVGLTAMAGAIGAGGLGTTAIVLGYQRFQTDVMWLATILLLIFIVIIQFSGDWLVRNTTHR